MITKIQKLSAIHNTIEDYPDYEVVVYDYKDTKIVSNSQLRLCELHFLRSCLWLQRYKNCQQFTTKVQIEKWLKELFMITKIQKLSAIHNVLVMLGVVGYVVYDYKDTKIVSNSQPRKVLKNTTKVVYDYKDTKIVSNSQQRSRTRTNACSCLWLQRYKNCQQFTTFRQSQGSQI